MIIFGWIFYKFKLVLPNKTALDYLLFTLWRWTTYFYNFFFFRNASAKVRVQVQSHFANSIKNFIPKMQAFKRALDLTCKGNGRDSQFNSLTRFQIFTI